MLLPAINKRAECTLKSSREDTLSCTWLFLHWCLLSSQKKNPQKRSVVITKSQKEVMLTSLSLRQDWCPLPDAGEGGADTEEWKGWKQDCCILERCTKQLSPERAGQWTVEACVNRGLIAAAHIAVQRNRKTCSLCCSQNFQVIDFQVRSAIFPKLKSFLEEQVLKSSTALYSAYLEGIQHRWGTNVSAKPCLPCSCVFTSPFDQSLCYSMWPLFWACLSLLSPGPGLHLYFWHLPHLTLLCFPLRRRIAALLRYQHLGSLLQPFILPR